MARDGQGRAPEDEDDADAITAITNMGAICGSVSGDAYACTRKANHGGDHVAALGCEIVDRWPVDELPILLAELAAAAEDCRLHPQRHPVVNPMETGYFQAADPVAARADWQKAWRRKEKAMEAVVKYAVLRYRGTEVK